MHTFLTVFELAMQEVNNQSVQLNQKDDNKLNLNEIPVINAYIFNSYSILSQINCSQTEKNNSYLTLDFLL